MPRTLYDKLSFIFCVASKCHDVMSRYKAGFPWWKPQKHLHDLGELCLRGNGLLISTKVHLPILRCFREHEGGLSFTTHEPSDIKHEYRLWQMNISMHVLYNVVWKADSFRLRYNSVHYSCPSTMVLFFVPREV